MESRLHKYYKTNVVSAMQKRFGYKNIMQVPRLVKVVLNVGYGKQVKDAAYIENVTNTIQVITGQKPVHNKSKRSISNFKIRAGMEIGVSTTLRGKRMYDFIDKLISVTLPRVRDFRGLEPKGFDRQGNYTIGFKEHIAFPEIKSDAIDKIHGLQVIVNTTATNQAEGLALLEEIGFPFKKK